MPNIAHTIIYAEDQKQYQKIVMMLKGNKEENVPSFNNIIPMPKSLHMQAGSVKDLMFELFTKVIRFKAMQFCAQHDLANIRLLNNYMNGYLKGVSNMSLPLGYDEKVDTVKVIIRQQAPDSPEQADELLADIKASTKKFMDVQFPESNKKSREMQMIEETIILPKGHTLNAEKYIKQYRLDGSNVLLDEQLSDIPYLKLIFNLSKRYFDNVIKYNASTWYDWSYDNWSTKWDMFDTDLNDKQHQISFLTAWSTPVNILEKLAEKCGQFKIYVHIESDPEPIRGIATADALLTEE